MAGLNLSRTSHQGLPPRPASPTPSRRLERNKPVVKRAPASGTNGFPSLFPGAPDGARERRRISQLSPASSPAPPGRSVLGVGCPVVAVATAPFTTGLFLSSLRLARPVDTRSRRIHPDHLRPPPDVTPRFFPNCRLARPMNRPLAPISSRPRSDPSECHPTISSEPQTRATDEPAVRTNFIPTAPPRQPRAGGSKEISRW